ncbi:MAG: hypothetical protein QG608_1060 [Actinomycetota bacterium]|nr:hypothetical protein [Actinomycetota bacterium]
MTLPTGESVEVAGRGSKVRVRLDGTDGPWAGAVHGIGDKIYVHPFRTPSEQESPGRAPDGLDREAFEVTGPSARARASSLSDGPSHITSPDGSAFPPSATSSKPLATSSNGTARTAKGETLRSVEVTLLDRQGRQAKKFWDFSALRVGGDYTQCVTTQPDADGVARFHLAAGIWIFYGEIYTTNGDRQEIVQFLRTGVRIQTPSADLPREEQAPLSLVLDGRETVRARLDVAGLGRTHDRGSVHGFSWSREFATASSYVVADERTDVYLTPATSVAEEGLTFTQVVSRRRSDAALTVSNARGRTVFDLDILLPDESIQGTNAVRLLPVGPSDTTGPSDATDARLPVGSLALARVGGTAGFVSGDDALAAARSRGARGAILWSAAGEDRRLRPQGTPAIPALTPVDGAGLAAVVGTGPLDGRITVDQWNHPGANLGRHVVGRIPADLDVTHPTSQLARVRQVFHPQPDVALGRDVRMSALGVAFDTDRFVKFGTTRTDYVTPDFLWEDSVFRCVSDWERGAWYSVRPRQFPVGQVSTQEWGGPVQRSSVLMDDNNDWVVRSVGKYIVGFTSYWTDRAGHPSSPGRQEKGTWQITSEGEERGSGTSDGVWGSALDGEHLYRLSYDVARPSTATEPPTSGTAAVEVSTVWTFPLEPEDEGGDPDDPQAGKIIPMLGVDPKVPVDSRGTVRAGSVVSFDVDGGLVGVEQSGLDSLRVWSWAEGGTAGGTEGPRVEAGCVRRVDANTFRVTLTHPRAPAGTRVGLRLVATGSNGTAIDQTVLAAYTLR